MTANELGSQAHPDVIARLRGNAHKMGPDFVYAVHDTLFRDRAATEGTAFSHIGHAVKETVLFLSDPSAVSRRVTSHEVHPDRTVTRARLRDVRTLLGVPVPDPDNPLQDCSPRTSFENVDLNGIVDSGQIHLELRRVRE